MDIYEYLKLDHKKVDNLFKDFEKTDDVVYKQALVETIIKELTVHSISEQETFYKLLLNFDESKKEAEHGWEEHEEIQALMDELTREKKFDKNWENKVKKLKELVHHHVKEEEGKMFREAKDVLTEEDAMMIKEKMHDYKGKLLLAFEDK